MAISVFDLFTIGIGPRARTRSGRCGRLGALSSSFAPPGCSIARPQVEVRLYGSLALTGKRARHRQGDPARPGRGEPEGIDPDEVEPRVAAIRAAGRLTLAGGPTIPFDESKHLLFLRKESLPQHPNGMRFTAFGETDSTRRLGSQLPAPCSRLPA